VPEGDVVWRTAQRLHAALAGRDLTRSDLRWPSLALVDLTGRQVLEVVSAGKHLLTRFGATDDEAPVTLHSHLRMEGSWQVCRTGRPAGRTRSPDVRALLANDTWTAVGLRLGMLDLVATVHEGQLVAHLGPDVLGAHWDADVVVAAMTARPERAVGDLLLDQRVLAGVGTFYMAETLFLRGVSPWTPAEQVSDLPALVSLVNRLMLANRDRAVQITTGDARDGRRNYVHARSGRPCLRCGGTVRVAMIGEPPRDRTAFYCPRCQPGPAPTDDGRTQAPLGARRPQAPLGAGRRNTRKRLP
jgi:endonuclease VIII